MLQTIFIIKPLHSPQGSTLQKVLEISNSLKTQTFTKQFKINICQPISTLRPPVLHSLPFCNRTSGGRSEELNPHPAAHLHRHTPIACVRSEHRQRGWDI
jgi:hypothetical protein